MGKMRFVVLFLAFLGSGSSIYFVHEPNSYPPAPPQNNPNVYTNYGVPLKRTYTNCSLNAIVVASGDKLGSLVRGAPRDCVDGIFSLNDSKAVTACNETNMRTIGYYFNGAAVSYDPKKAWSSSILNFVLYLRACYYIQNQNETLITKYSPDLYKLIRSGLNTFFQCQNLDAHNDDHYEILREVITLLVNMKESINYSSFLAHLLTKLSSVWMFGSSVFIQKTSQSEVVDSIYNNFFRTHRDEKVATDYYCKPQLEVALSLNRFLDTRIDLVNSTNEWTLQNAALEFGRFSKYACINKTIIPLLKKQSEKYNINYAPKVYCSLLETWSYHEGKNCKTYGFCNFKADLLKKVLPFTKFCDKSSGTDTYKIRAQNISVAQAKQVCERLKYQEIYFHILVDDHLQPVKPDTNTLIEVVIFKNVDEYKFYATKLFGIRTDNGGMYLEGDPSKPGNIGRYFCYEKSKNGTFDIWNLEHEFTHYLDGRYDMLGDFSTLQNFSNSGHIVWWVEGFSEYAAYKTSDPDMIQACTAKEYNLSTIFNNNYMSSVERTYAYGYLAARFMFERHRSDVDKILSYFRFGKYKQYEDFMIGIGKKYDKEFSKWCDCIAVKMPC